VAACVLAVLVSAAFAASTAIAFHPLLPWLALRELPAALVICVSGRQRRRALCRILERRRAAAAVPALPAALLPRPEKTRLRVAAAGPPRAPALPPDAGSFCAMAASARDGSARERLARSEASLLADPAGFMRLNSAAMAEVTEACALLIRGFVTVDEARDRVAALPALREPRLELADESARPGFVLGLAVAPVPLPLAVVPAASSPREPE
jgi:hypothetical protein